MSRPPTNVESDCKRQVPPDIRKPQLLALQAAGLTQEEIAKVFGISRRTVERDLDEIKPARLDFTSRLSELMLNLNSILSVEERALQYADLATNAKNEAVRLGTLQRIDDLDGIVTQKELVRTRRDDAATTVQPMFVLPANSHISVTVDTTTYSNKDAASNIQEPVRDITPSPIDLQLASPTESSDTNSHRKAE